VAPPSADLLRLFRDVNLDFLFAYITGPETIDQIISWLNVSHPLPSVQTFLVLMEAQTFNPVPAELIAVWKDYRFLNFFSSVLPEPGMEDGSLPANISVQDCRQIISNSPGLIRIIRALLLGNVYTPTLFCLRTLLGCSWGELRTAVLPLRTLVGEDERHLRGIFAFVHNRTIMSELFPAPIVSRDLARGCIRLIKGIATGTLPVDYW
jgi:hypothetical protein